MKQDNIAEAGAGASGEHRASNILLNQWLVQDPQWTSLQHLNIVV